MSVKTLHWRACRGWWPKNDVSIAGAELSVAAFCGQAVQRGVIDAPPSLLDTAKAKTEIKKHIKLEQSKKPKRQTRCVLRSTRTHSI